MEETQEGVISFVGQNNKWNTAEEAANIVHAINSAKVVKCLKLEANTLGVEAARVIGDALANRPEFERAHWKDLFTGRLKNEIPEALKHLFSGLIRAKAKLLEIDLSDNALGPVGVEGMVDFMKSPVCYSLQEIHLNNNGLGIKGGTMLANSLKELVKNARANGTPLQLKVFIVGRNRLEVPGAIIYSELFSSIKSLEEIQMPQNGILEKGIAALAKAFADNPNLKHINLNDNTFTPAGANAMAAYLSCMQNLEIINFGDCLIKTAGAESIARVLVEGHHKLKELHLDSNEIGIEGGLSIVDAVVNDKPDFKLLMLDWNQFGEDRRDEITERLYDYGMPDILGTLENDEEPDDGEEEEETLSGEEDLEDDEDDDAYTTEEEEVVEDFCGISPLRRGYVTPSKKVEIPAEKECTSAEFYSRPTAERLVSIPMPQLELVEEVFRMARNVEQEEIIGMPTFTMTLINEFCRAFVIVAQFSSSTDAKTLEIVNACACSLAQAAFDRAIKEDILSVATNSLLVHFGLIKSEKKTFTLDWDLKGCLKTMCHVGSQPFFPKETRTAMQLFLSKPNKHLDVHHNEKHRLLSALYKF